MEVISADQLTSQGRRVVTPFTLLVRRAEGEAELNVVKVLRLLPGKRIVAVAIHDGKAKLIKCYFGGSASRYSKREIDGVKLINKAGVRTAGLCWQGRIADGSGEVLVFDYLDTATSLYDRWQQSQHREDRVDVLTRAMVILGKLHNYGVVQNDIHLDNFLLASGKLYTIDGGHVVSRSRLPLPEATSLDNLGLFFAQLYPRFDEFVPIVLPAYETVRGWSMDGARLQRLGMAIAVNRSHRKKNYIAKAFRDCTRFVCNRSFHRFAVCDRAYFDDEMARLIEDPDTAMGRGTLLKDGNTSTVALVQLSDRMLVIKRYNLTSVFHRLRRSVRNTRAWTSWANACRLEFLGIPSVKPVALIENRFGPLRGTAYFVSEFVEGQDALRCIKELKTINGELEALTSLLFDFSQNRISHGDLKATNFVMSGRGPVVLDLDSMREHRSEISFKRAFRRDINRFMKNWSDRPELLVRFEKLIGNLGS